MHFVSDPPSNLTAAGIPRPSGPRHTNKSSTASLVANVRYAKAAQMRSSNVDNSRMRGVIFSI